MVLLGEETDLNYFGAVQYKLFILYVVMGLSWDILFSPLGLYSRTYAAFMLVVVLSSKEVSKNYNKL